MDNVLFLLGSYSPHPSANGVCVANLASYYLEKGYSVTCLCDKTGTQVCFHEHGVLVHSIELPFDKRVNKVIEGKLESNSSVFIRFIYSIVSHALLFTTFFSYPVNKKHVRRIVEEAKTIICQNNTKIIIGVNMPVDMIYAASVIKKNNTNIHYVSYFLDPLAMACNHSLLGKKKSFKRGMKYERIIVKNSDTVLSQFEHRKYFEKNYAGNDLKKVKFIGVPLLKNYVQNYGYVANNRMKGIYAGAFWNGIRSPEYIIALFKMIPSIDVYLYVSSGRAWVDRLITDAPNIHLCDSLAHHEMINVMQNADFLINVGNNLENQAPSKLYEYFGFGKPIVSTCCISNDPSLELLKKYGNYISIDEKNDDIEESAKMVEQYLRKDKMIISFKELERCFYYSTPKAFFEIVEASRSEQNI